MSTRDKVTKLKQEVTYQLFENDTTSIPEEDDVLYSNDYCLDLHHGDDQRSIINMECGNSVKYIDKQDCIDISDINSSSTECAKTPERKQSNSETRYVTRNIKIPNSFWFSKKPDNESGVKVVTSKVVVDHTKTTRLVQDLAADKLCRICGRFDKSSLQPIFGELSEDRRIPFIIKKYLPIMISKDEETLPKGICLMCFTYLVDWQCLIDRCQATDEWLHKIFNVPRTQYGALNANDVFLNKTPQNVSRKQYTSSANDALLNETSEIGNTEEINQVTNTAKKYNKRKSTFSDKDHNYCTNSSTNEISNTEGSKCTASDWSGHIDTDESTTEILCETMSESGNDNTDERSKRLKRKSHCKVFNLCVCDELDGSTQEDNIAVGDNTFSKCSEMHTVTIDNYADGQEKLTNDSIDYSQTTVDENSITLFEDENSRNKLSVVSDSVLFGSCETDSLNESDVDEQWLANPRNAFDSFIEKQRYRVSITVVKKQKQDIVRSQPKVPKRRTQMDVNSVDRVTIALIKFNREDMRAINSHKNEIANYSKLSSFRCELCSCFPMTAIEYGRHMKLLHYDYPHKCPVCEKTFKEDYNLIIHLQVTHCSRLVTSKGKAEGKRNEQSPERGNESQLDVSQKADLSTCFKITLKTTEPNNSNENCKFNIEYIIDNNDDTYLNTNIKDYLYHEIAIDTWKPLSTRVFFDPGFVLLDTMKSFDEDLETIIISEIKKLLNMELLSVSDCNALRLLMENKLNTILNKIGDDKVIRIKSVEPNQLENENDVASISNKSPIQQRAQLKNILIRSVKRSLKGRRGLSARRKKTMKIVQTQDPVTCDECGKKYRNSKAMCNHKKLMHMEMKCNHCDKLLPSLNALKKHRKEHVKENLLTCNDCNLKFYNMDRLNKHKLVVHNIGDFLNCNICDKKFVSSISLYKHKKNVHTSQTILCTQCGNMYKTLTALRCHIRNRHMNLVKTFECSICKKAFKTSNKLKVHSLRHSDKKEIIDCDICHKQFTSKDAVRRHKQELHSEQPCVFCTICNVGFYRSSRLPLHLKAIHWTTVNRKGSEQFPCLLCGVMLEDGDSLSQHMMFHVDDDKIKEVCGEGVGRNKCNYCGNYLRGKKDLALHVFFIHHDQPFRCGSVKDCDQKFWSKAALDEHEVNAHVDSNVCHICKHVFGNAKKKEAHIRRMHSEDFTPYFCPECHKTFRSAYTLKRHSVTHSNLKPYSCTKCNRHFSLPQILAKHMLWHQRQEQKCKEKGATDICKTDFTTEQQYQVGNFNEASNNQSEITYEVIQVDDANHQLEFLDDGLVVPHLDIEQVEVTTSVVIGEVVDVCTVYKCMQCNLMFNLKTAFDEHCSDYHNTNTENNYEHNEV